MANEFWDRMFESEPYRYGVEPNAFLRECAAAIAPAGAVLCLGDGEGRNGVWLAEQGFHVTSLDQSAVGLAKARTLAARRGVTLETVEAELPQYSLPAGAFDAVVLVFLHLPSQVRPAVHAAAVRALRPGGVAILEAFTPRQLRYASGGPPLADRLQSAEQLRSDFAALAIERLEETETLLEEGEGHKGLGHVVRMLARHRLAG